MRLARMFGCAALALFACVSISNAQDLSGVEQGIKPYGSYKGGDIDSVSMVNGSLTLSLPVVSYPQRGGILHVGFRLQYANPWLQPFAGNCNPFTHFCSNTGYNLVYLTDPSSATFRSLTGFTWGTALRVSADFNPGPSLVYLNSQCCPQPIKYFFVTEPDGAVHKIGSAGGRSVDASGYVFFPGTTSGTGTLNTAGRLYDRQGTLYDFTGSSSKSIEDVNGNFITNGTGVWTDTMGRTIPDPSKATSTTDLSNCPASATTASIWSPPGPNGSNSQYKFCWASISIAFTPPDCTSTLNCGATSTTATNMVALVLPNATAWTFGYDNFGELTSVTLPTGGSISYTWTYISGTTCVAPKYVEPVSGYNTQLLPYRRAITSRTVNANDGTGPHTWNYAMNTNFSGVSTQTIETDPLGNDTVHTMTALGGTCSVYETQTDRYAGSHTAGTLLQTTATTYSYTVASAIGGPVVNNLVPNTITTTDTVSGKVSKVVKTYDSGSTTGVVLGDLLSESDYDFGNGAAGSLLRKTTNTYMALSGPNASSYLTNNLVSLPYTTQVQDGSGTQLSLTQYNYDESTRASSGLSSANQWDSAPSSGTFRGNNTSLYRWLNSGTFSCPNGHSGGSGGNLISTKTYFDNGMLNTSADPCSNATTYAYNLTYWGALPTTITNALGQATNNTYDFSTGLLASTTDPNNLTTNYNIVPYDSMWRLRQVNHPDGGITTYCYTDGLPANCSSGNAGSHPFAVIVGKSINSSKSEVSTAVLDGFARTSESQLNSDPQGVVYTDTTYDALGRVSTVSNPYRTGTDATTSTGTTTYGYDALSRKITVTYPQTGTGTSVLTTAYCGPSTLVTDPTGKWRRSRVDGLGRLVEVDEPNSPTATVNISGCPGTGEPIWVTSYTNDALGNLTNVVQNGSHQRTFTYDSLSRLLCSSNPENSSAACPAFGGALPSSGAVVYAYNPDGTVLKKTDSRSITTNYAYEALLRTTGVTYSNGDPALTFTYDQSSCLALSAPCHNIGHRTSMTDGAGSESWAYKVDATNLRSVHQEQRTNGTLAAKTTTYYLDLAGNVTQLNYPTGRIVNYTYDSADRPSTATDSSNGITYATGWPTPPASTACVSTAVCYTPQGTPYATDIAKSSSFAGINILESYNSRLQPNEIKASAPTTYGNALDVSYNFVDAVSHGNAGVVYGITNNLNAARSQTFTYDQLNRILSANTGATTTGTYCFGYQFSYNAWGNLLSQTQDSNYSACSQSNMGTVAEDSAGKNHLATFSYDAAGNTSNDTFYNYTWDGESQLKTANGTTYSYDGDGRRAAKVNSKYYWYGSGGEILAETDYSGNLQSEYVFFAGKRVALVPASGDKLYYIEDMLGSSRVISKVTALCYDGDFTPYGGERSYTNSCAQNYKFEGKERDTETQNDDFGAREYSWRFGRWLSSDWSSTPEAVPYANLSNPQTLNLYAMVSDDPESFADLDGHKDAAYYFGLVNAWGSDNLFGIGRVESSNPSYQQGQIAGDTAAAAQGLGEVAAGNAGVGAGTALLPSGLVTEGAGTAAGGIVITGSVALQAHGAVTATVATVHLVAESSGQTTSSSSTSDKPQTGSYTNTHASGKTYSGKGSKARSQASGRRIARKTGDTHVATQWTPSANEREAFKAESRRIDANGGVSSDSNYNRVESPGKNYRAQDETPR
jgi:RHS repeat-associated protein